MNEEKPELKTAIFSFGMEHAHRVNGVTFDCDCLVRITSQDPVQTMFDTFGAKWGMEYTEESAQKAIRHFPRGIIDL